LVEEFLFSTDSASTAEEDEGASTEDEEQNEGEDDAESDAQDTSVVRFGGGRGWCLRGRA